MLTLRKSFTKYLALRVLAKSEEVRPNKFVNVSKKANIVEFERVAATNQTRLDERSRSRASHDADHEF